MAYRTLSIKGWLISTLLFLLTSCDTQGNTMKANEFFNKQTQTLIKAVEKGRREEAQTLLQRGANFNRHGKDGITPLFYLLINQDKPAMRLALALGADANLAEPNGNTPVAMASGANDDELLQILLEGGGDPNSTDHNNHPAIFGAIGEERINQIKLLIEHGVDLNLQDPQSRNSALYSAYINQYEIVHFLIEQGASYNSYDALYTTIAWHIHNSLERDLPSRKFTAYEWALKVKQQLIDLNVEFPPLSPLESRYKEGALTDFHINQLKNRRKKGITDEVDLKLIKELGI